MGRNWEPMNADMFQLSEDDIAVTTGLKLDEGSKQQRCFAEVICRCGTSTGLRPRLQSATSPELRYTEAISPRAAPTPSLQRAASIAIPERCAL